MQARPVRIPGPEHSIAIEPAKGIVSVTVDKVEVARSNRALALFEAGYPVVYYVPRGDVEMTALSLGSKETYCPYKGEATHYDIDIGGDRSENAAWSYEAPFDAVSEIEGHVAFYAAKAEIDLSSN